jgi:dTDP-4-amino-4,6-dideoxygalactose transaminase
MSRSNITRRKFVRQSSLAGLGAVAISAIPSVFTGCSGDTPAVMGGRPVHRTGWPVWPQWNQDTDEARFLEVIRSGIWSRSKVVSEFEQKWAGVCGTTRCLGVINGTNALIASLVNLGIGGGDEVIVPPYTFVATVLAVLQAGAIPVFADTDLDTFQIDPEKIKQKINPKTKAILPVHILGIPADMTRIMEIAKEHNLIVVEDACQGWLAEVDKKRVGSFGNAGCFSFQTSKNLPMGEGGAIVSDDEEFMDRCYSFHNYGHAYGTLVGAIGSGAVMAGTKQRMAEYQAILGLIMLERLEEQTAKRNENAGYLRKELGKIQGIRPAVLKEYVTRSADHIFAFRYNKDEFGGLSRLDFQKALIAEGIPCSGGYTPLNKMEFIANAFKTKNYKKMYSSDVLDYSKYMEQNQCPVNDRLCEETIWFTQNLLLGNHEDMDDIIAAVGKIKANASRITKLGNLVQRVQDQEYELRY